MGRIVSPTPTPLSSGRVVPALVASYDMHGRAVGLFYTQPTGHCGAVRRLKKSRTAPCNAIIIIIIIIIIRSLCIMMFAALNNPQQN